MRILNVAPDQYERHRDFLRQMHRLRATVFGGRLAWDVSITAGQERDQYDDCRPTYLLAIAGGGKVAGCVSLLPASGPTMLEQTFPQLLDAGSFRPHSGMVESSRFCVDTSPDSQRGASQLHLATLTLFAGIIEWPMQRLGEPASIGHTIASAGSLPADRSSFEQGCPQDYHSTSRIDGSLLRSAA
ncbi:acyl-homoserine-lactone synthase [Agrobacterium tumefaciens]|uniref:acyl-homoserine-lactone synthase n=1 Tax=Agrobacterium tumefaciens TaxID=358 RepID=UPI000978877F|nr:autoinducer synthesis protein [Agrobacterium tumefaciens]